MNFLAKKSNKITTIRQHENNECALASIAMICNFYGKNISLSDFRNSRHYSSRGFNLRQLINLAADFNLNSRPLRISFDKLAELRLPAILHWNLDHFVVLEKISGKNLIIHDPGVGKRTMSFADADKFFTGIAIEFWPDENFIKNKSAKKHKLLSLLPDLSRFKKKISNILFVALLGQSILLLLPLCFQALIDQIAIANNLYMLKVLAIFLTGIYLVQAILNYLKGMETLFFTVELNYHLKSSLFARLLRLPASFFNRRNFSEIMAKFSAVNNINELISDPLISGLVNGFFALILLVFIWYYSFVFFLFSICSVGILLGINHFFGKKLFNEQFQYISAAPKENHILLESIRGIQTLKINNLLSFWATKFNNTILNIFRINIKVNKIQNAKNCAESFWFGLDQIISICLGVSLVMNNSITIGMLFAFIAIKNQLNERIRPLLASINQLNYLRIYLDKMSDISLNKIEEDEKNIWQNYGILQGNLEINNVSFSYDNTSKIFDSLSLKINSGETVAVIGRSGSGKTTLLKLILGLLKPSSGNILIDGKILGGDVITWLRDQVSTVMQEDYLFSGTILDNICMFSEQIDEEKALEACRLANIYSEIKSMPMGIYSRINDMGSTFSGGQKQRILIARALYKAPRMLLLDEATSNLDKNSEKIINQHIKNLGITRIIVAHRQETIEMADRIISI